MTSPERDPAAAGLLAEQLLLDLREANEKLILAAIESAELKDRAEAAQAAAELSARALQESKRELLANAEFREQLLTIVGHDLRNPLAAIAMATQLLVNHGQLSKADLKLTVMVKKSAMRMQNMIAHLLDFTRVRLGDGLGIQAKPVDLRSICKQAIGELAVQPGVEIHSEFDGDLTGVWDGPRLIQVMSNILGNAVDHATPGTPVLLRACKKDANAEVVVEISNQGPPIPADLLPVLFAAFRSGRDLTHSKLGHVGLGLYIAREIIVSHGGTLAAGSAGGTTTFSICLPRPSDPE